MTDGTGAVVWNAAVTPFGIEHSISGSEANNNRFPGQYFDAETSLHYNHWRDYDPTTGRYVQSDPIGLAGGLNTYAYAGGNPVNLVDPDGLMASICMRNPWMQGCLGPEMGVGGGTNQSPSSPAAIGLGGFIAACAVYVRGLLMGNIDCEKLYQDDTDTCNAITRARGKAAGRRCHAAAARRYAACLRGEDIPPLDTWNN